MKSAAIGACLALFVAAAAWAQAPVGTITGTVRDQSDAVVPGASVTIRHAATGAERHLTSGADGTFSAPALAAGEYAVTAELTGFRTQKIDVTVATGRVVTVDMRMELGQAAETVTVAAAASHVEMEAHAVTGLVTRQKIQELPLNGRSFLQLAFLEPGVTASPGSTSQYNSLFSVSILGGDSNKTAITVDGGNIRNSIEGNTGMNFSQEVVEEFQLSSANFDLSTGITSVGAVNIVTRSGGNDTRGSAYFFFRNNDMAAYPALRRDPLNPDPEFSRSNPGLWVGGPIRRNRLFYFSNYEYTSQEGVVSFQPNLASASGLAGVFPNPYNGHLFSTRVDWKANDKHTAFFRYSHDQNKGFGPSGNPTLPSNWLRNTNKSDQSVVGLTSIFGSSFVNDFRFNFTFWNNRNLFADETTCDDCIGLGFPQLNINGTNVTVGHTQNATQGRDLYRYTFVDTMTWQKGSHRLRFGTELEYAPGHGVLGLLRSRVHRGVLAGVHAHVGHPGGDNGGTLPQPADDDHDQPGSAEPAVCRRPGGRGRPRTTAAVQPRRGEDQQPDALLRAGHLEDQAALDAQLRPGVELREHAGQSRHRQAALPGAALRQRSQRDEKQLRQLVALVRLRLGARRFEQDSAARRCGPLLGNRAACGAACRSARRSARSATGVCRFRTPASSTSSPGSSISTPDSRCPSVPRCRRADRSRT